MGLRVDKVGDGETEARLWASDSRGGVHLQGFWQSSLMLDFAFVKVTLFLRVGLGTHLRGGVGTLRDPFGRCYDTDGI